MVDNAHVFASNDSILGMAALQTMVLGILKEFKALAAEKMKRNQCVSL